MRASQIKIGEHYAFNSTGYLRACIRVKVISDTNIPAGQRTAHVDVVDDHGVVANVPVGFLRHEWELHERIVPAGAIAHHALKSVKDDARFAPQVTLLDDAGV